MFRWFQRHPSEVLLISYLDGEVPEKEQVCIQNHLKKCTRCKTRAAKIEEDWRRFIELASEASSEPSFSENELIAKTRNSIHEWIQTNPPVSSTPTTQLSAQPESCRRALAAILKAGEALRIACKKSIVSAASVLRILTGRKGAKAREAKILRMMNQHTGADSEPSGSWRHANKKS